MSHFKRCPFCDTANPNLMREGKITTEHSLSSEPTYLQCVNPECKGTYGVAYEKEESDGNTGTNSC